MSQQRHHISYDIFYLMLQTEAYQVLAQVSDNDEISHQTSAPITERRLQDGDSLNEVDYRTCISGGGG